MGAVGFEASASGPVLTFPLRACIPAKSLIDALLSLQSNASDGIDIPVSEGSTSPGHEDHGDLSSDSRGSEESQFGVQAELSSTTAESTLQRAAGSEESVNVWRAAEEERDRLQETLQALQGAFEASSQEPSHGEDDPGDKATWMLSQDLPAVPQQVTSVTQPVTYEAAPAVAHEQVEPALQEQTMTPQEWLPSSGNSNQWMQQDWTSWWWPNEATCWSDHDEHWPSNGIAARWLPPGSSARPAVEPLPEAQRRPTRRGCRGGRWVQEKKAA